MPKEGASGAFRKKKEVDRSIRPGTEEKRGFTLKPGRSCQTKGGLFPVESKEKGGGKGPQSEGSKQVRERGRGRKSCRQNEKINTAFRRGGREEMTCCPLVELAWKEERNSEGEREKEKKGSPAAAGSKGDPSLSFFKATKRKGDRPNKKQGSPPKRGKSEITLAGKSIILGIIRRMKSFKRG